jgi:dTDP-4-amino-4,6-dideoxygalactose transaminase
VLPVEVLFGRERRQDLPFPMGEPGVLLTYSGTAAIYQAFLALGLPPGSTVLCPSYNCGHEIEPLLRLGLRVECFRVTADLRVDVEDIANRLESGAAAVMITHYFGFAQPLPELRELCDIHGAFLVEDCAHALFSDNATGDLGRVGDLAIYSTRKTLPIPNGGAVIANNAALRPNRSLTAPPRLTTWLKSLDLTAKSVWDRYAAERWVGDIAWLSARLPLVAGSRLL